MDDDEYKVYVGGIVAQLHEYYTDASFMAFNFREGDKQSYLAKILSEYDMTVMDYPRLYETCPLLTMEMVHHFLRSCESWLLLGQRNVLLMHCERGGWPILAFMLAAMLIYRKQYTGEQKTLDMIYKQAPRELLQLMSPLNPLPSQLRYLQYISRRNVGSEWPPIDRALTMDCIILRFIPNMDGEGGCRPVFRIYGPDPLMVADRTPKVLFSTSKRSKVVRHYKQADCQLVKIDINCHVQGDVVLECISLDDDLEHEKMMFRVMFNTAFIRSNILMLNRDEVDLSWDGKECFPKDFRAEVIFSEMDSTSSAVTHDVPSIEENEGLPIEAFAKVKEIFSTVDWLETRKDVALTVLQRITSAHLLQEKLDSAFLECSPRISASNNLLHKHLAKETDESLPMDLEDNISISPSLSLGELSSPSPETSADLKSLYKKNEFRGLQISVDQPKIVSQRALQTSPSTPTLNISSPQASAMSISRFHSAPSFLGITALLHDHAEPKAKEFCVPVITTPVAAVSSSLEHVYSPVQSAVNSNLESSQSPSSLLLSEARTMTADIIPPLTPTSLSRSPPIVSEISTTVESSATPSPTPPPPPLPPSFVKSSSSLSSKNSDSSTTLAPPSSYEVYPSATVRNSIPLPPPLPTSSNVVLSRPTNNVSSIPSPPPLPPVPSPGVVPSTFIPSRAMTCPPPPPPPPPCLEPAGPTKCTAPAPPPPPPPAPKFGSKDAMDSPNVPPVPPPPAPSFASKGPLEKNSPHVPPVPPPPAPASNGLLKSGGTASSNGNIPPIPGPPLNANGRLNLRAGVKNPGQSSKKSNLKPYHWLKLTRAMQGSLWAEAQKPDEASKAPEFDMSELETLFSVNVPNSDLGSRGKSNRRTSATKPEKVSLVDFRRAYNCEIMLSKIKIPLPDMMSAVLALDDSVLDIDQVENLIKYCPTKEEMELLKNYKGDKENLGKCEQFFFELMKVPRVEAKLRVFAFKIQFCSQVSDLRKSLNVVNCTSEEVRNSVKLKRIMQTILSLGNALNHGTARGSAVGFRLDSLLKLTDTRARNNKLTLMHYLCKVLAEKLPELLDFHKDLVSLEGSTKIQLKYLAEEMQAISKGLEKIVQELIASENDGPVSETFCQILKEFLGYAEAEVRSLASLYSIVGKNADALALYFGEDPARCPFEQVVSTLRNFVRLFVRAHDENCKQLEFEKKKALKEGENEKGNSSTPRKRPDMETMKSNECAEHLLRT